MARPGFFLGNDSSDQGAVVHIYLQWTSLVTGGIPTTLARASGITSVARTGVGLFTITFAEPWALKWLDFQFACQQVTYSASGACEANILTDNLMATTGVMTVNITNQAGAVVDPTTGDYVSFHFTMQTHAPGQ